MSETEKKGRKKKIKFIKQEQKEKKQIKVREKY